MTLPIRCTTRRPLLRALAGLAAGLPLGLAACSTPAPRAFPQIGFENRPPIALDVGTLTVVQQYRPSGTPPHVETRMPDSLNLIAERWARQRLAPVGTAGEARVIVEEASVIEEALARSGGVRGALTIEPSERYRLRLAVRIEAANPARGLDGWVRSVAERSVTVAENASLAQREQAWFDLLEGAATDIDAQLEQNLRANMAGLVVR
jgi:hypothetical protein